MATKGTLSRKAALKRSRRILTRALRVFHASPSSATRAPVEHALDAVQRADQLAEQPQLRANEDVRRWEDPTSDLVIVKARIWGPGGKTPARSPSILVRRTR